MKLLTVNQEVSANIFGNTYHLKPITNPNAGPENILAMDDGSASELLRKHKNILSTVSINTHDISHYPKPFEKLEAIRSRSKILMLRSGGIGDHIMLLPALRLLKESTASKSVKLWLSVQKDMLPIFSENPYIDRLFPLPIPLHRFLEADYFIDFSDQLNNAIGPDLHLTDFFLMRLGLKNINTYDPMSDISLKNLSGSMEISTLYRNLRASNPNRPIIALNWFASTHIKSLPPSLFTSLSNKFSEVIFLVIHHESKTRDTDNNLKSHNIKAINISTHMKSLIDYFTAVSLSDAVVCADTSTYHMASIYNKPSLVIIGPTYSILTKYYAKCSFIQSHYTGDTCTSPCGRTKGHCPEAKQLGTRYSPCLMEISENSILMNFRQFLDTYF